MFIFDDIFGRFGGDEFAAVFIDKNIEQGIKIINRICSIFESNYLEFEREKIRISFAYGLAQFLTDSDDVNELLKIADQRMYEKKKKMKVK